jgi:hypothetical protein
MHALESCQNILSKLNTGRSRCGLVEIDLYNFVSSE